MRQKVVSGGIVYSGSNTGGAAAVGAADGGCMMACLKRRLEAWIVPVTVAVRVAMQRA